ASSPASLPLHDALPILSPDAAISLAKCSALPPVTTASVARFWMSYTLSAASRGSDLMYLTCSAMMDCITWPTGALSTRLRSSRRSEEHTSELQSRFDLV